MSEDDALRMVLEQLRSAIRALSGPRDSRQQCKALIEGAVARVQGVIDLTGQDSEGSHGRKRTRREGPGSNSDRCSTGLRASARREAAGAGGDERARAGSTRIGPDKRSIRASAREAARAGGGAARGIAEVIPPPAPATVRQVVQRILTPEPPAEGSAGKELCADRIWSIIQADPALMGTVASKADLRTFLKDQARIVGKSGMFLFPGLRSCGTIPDP